MVDLAAVMVVPVTIKVDLAKAYDGRIAVHTTFVVAWFAATVVRVAPAIVVVVLVAASSGIVVAWMTLAVMKIGLSFEWMELVAMKVSLVAAGFVLVVAKALEQFPE